MALCSAGAAPARAQVLQPVVLQLKWHHAFQFAGYYAAQAQGYYREAGLAVEIRPADPDLDVVEQVVSGRAQYGVGNSSLLLARAAGQPVVVLANVFQHSPLALAVRVAGPGDTLHDLAGRRVMIERQSEELLAYLAQEGLSTRRFTALPHSFQIQDLIDGRVDAATIYLTNETHALERSGLRYHVYTPRAVGIDFYGDNLFTTERELDAHPDRVAAFRAASLRGWAHALAHPQEVIDLIRRVHAPEATPEFLSHEARRMVPLIRADLVEIGYMNPGRWSHIASVYADLGLLPREVRFPGFLYDPHRGQLDLAELRPYLWAAGAVLLLGAGGMLHIVRINRRLRATVVQIRHMAQHDPLTHLPNRALWSERLNQALAQGRPLALMFMDLDHFKPINDLHGHDVGDRVLQATAHRLSEVVGPQGTVARIGGDEFVMLLPGVASADEALAVAERIHQALIPPVAVAHRHLSLRASLGVALAPQHGQTELALARAADVAMYMAKRTGRNACWVFDPDWPQDLMDTGRAPPPPPELERSAA